MLSRLYYYSTITYVGVAFWRRWHHNVLEAASIGNLLYLARCSVIQGGYRSFGRRRGNDSRQCARPGKNLNELIEKKSDYHERCQAAKVIVLP